MNEHPEVPRDTVDLPGGGRMPLLGFGTWQLRGRDAEDATRAALEAGYRHVDTATMYRNQTEIGRALGSNVVPREQLFITTKCPPDRAGHELETLEDSLAQLGIDQVDLWLVHWPARDTATVDMWQAFARAQQQGLTRDIGVSNFDADLIDEVTDKVGVTPAVNQVEWSPLLYDADVVAAHRQRDVVLEGYSGLKGGVLEHPVVREVAERAGRTPAQVVLRWHVQHGVVAIPKSQDPGRIRANADLGGFTLSEEDMAALDGLGQSSVDQ